MSFFQLFLLLLLLLLFQKGAREGFHSGTQKRSKQHDGRAKDRGQPYLEDYAGEEEYEEREYYRSPSPGSIGDVSRNVELNTGLFTADDISIDDPVPWFRGEYRYSPDPIQRFFFLFSFFFFLFLFSFLKLSDWKRENLKEEEQKEQ